MLLDLSSFFLNKRKIKFRNYSLIYFVLAPDKLGAHSHKVRLFY